MQRLREVNDLPKATQVAEDKPDLHEDRPPIAFLDSLCWEEESKCPEGGRSMQVDRAQRSHCHFSLKDRTCSVVATVPGCPGIRRQPATMVEFHFVESCKAVAG